MPGEPTEYLRKEEFERCYYLATRLAVFTLYGDALRPRRPLFAGG